MDFNHQKKINTLKYRQAYKQSRKKSSKNLILKGFLIFTLCIFAGLLNQYMDQSKKIQRENKNLKQKNTIHQFSPILSPKIFDGDSFDVTYNGEKIHVRLYGIDSPEKTQAYSNVSHKMLSSLLQENTIIHLEILYQDKYKRAVSIVHFEDGSTAQDILLNAGLTWVYKQYCDREICNEWHELEKNTQQNKIGLWQDKNPTPPWQWRKKNK